MADRHMLEPWRQLLRRPGPPKVIFVVALVVLIGLVALAAVRNNDATGEGPATGTEHSGRPAVPSAAGSAAA